MKKKERLEVIPSTYEMPTPMQERSSASLVPQVMPYVLCTVGYRQPRENVDRILGIVEVWKANKMYPEEVWVGVHAPLHECVG